MTRQSYKEKKEMQREMAFLFLSRRSKSDISWGQRNIFTGIFALIGMEFKEI